MGVCHCVKAVEEFVSCCAVSVGDDDCVVNGCAHLHCGDDEVADEHNRVSKEEGEDEIDPNSTLNCKDKHKGQEYVFEGEEEDDEDEEQ